VIRERVVRALELVGCAGLERRHPNQLSGGQQQRVAIARAVVGGSRVVLFDEPLSSVDARVREELRGELVALQRELGFSSVYITHDQTEAMAIGHRVAVLDKGKIVQIGPPRELYNRPATRYVAEFLGAANRIPGTLETSGGPYWSIVTCAGLGRVIAECSAAAPGSGITPSAQVTAVVRAEDFQLSTMQPPADQPNQWGCTVERSLFLGACTEYVVEVNGQRVTARSSDKHVLAEHASAWLSVAPSDVRVLTE
jgi:iron(III) transport system ATP-binding protein